jgi:hypothetical protein
MRSALTVLGIVIGITSIVGMTSLIRGFDESLRASIMELGPKTIFVQRFGAVSFSSGASFTRCAPAEPHGRRRRGHQATGAVGGDRRHLAGRRRRSPRRSGCSTAASAPRPSRSWAPASASSTSTSRRWSWAGVHGAGGRAAPGVAVIGYGPYEALFEQKGIDPIGKRSASAPSSTRSSASSASVRRRRLQHSGRTTSSSFPTRRSASSSAPKRRAPGPFGGPGGDDRGGAA